MADQVIGTARIDITASSEGVEAATAKAKASISSMSKDAQAQYSKLSAAEKHRVDSLIRQADTVGMTRAQQIAYNASLKSSGPLLDDLTRRLKLTEAAAQKTGSQFNQYGLTTEQRRWAAREGVINDARTQAAAAAADADRARAASDGLRKKLAVLQRRARDSAAAGGGQAAGDPIGVLAVVLGELDDRAGILARYADANRIAGLACERAYESLR